MSRLPTFYPLANCYLKDVVPRVFLDARVFFCPEKGIKKTARYGGWSMQGMNFLIVIKPRRRVPPEVFRAVWILWFPAKPTL